MRYGHLPLRSHQCDQISQSFQIGDLLFMVASPGLNAPLTHSDISIVLLVEEPESGKNKKKWMYRLNQFNAK